MAIDADAIPKASMAAIGERLRQAREKKALTTEQAQKQTRIYAAVLNALEDGRCDAILTSVYVRGFLKKYADFLGLDSREILREYTMIHSSGRKAEHNGAEQLKAQGESKSSLAVKPRPELKLADMDTWRIRRRIRAIVIIAIAAAILFFIGKVILVKRPRPGKAASKVVTTPKKAAGAFAQKTAPNKPQSRQSIPNTVPLKLELLVKKQVFVKVKSDGKLLYERVLPKGAKETITAASSIRLYVARCENIELNLNGSPVAITEKGVVRDIDITRKGVRITR